MALDTRSFFVGIATVLGILLVGFGGGIMMGGVISGDQKSPNRIERQVVKDSPAKDTKEIKPAAEPVVVTASQPVPAAAPSQPVPAAASASTPQSSPASAQAAVPAPALAPEATPAQAPRQPQPAVPAESAQQPAPVPAMAADAKLQPLGRERPVSLVQPSEQDLRQATAKARDAKARAERQKAERQKQMAERRRQEEMRREERAAAVHPRRRDADDEDDEDERPIVRPRGFFDGLWRPLNDGPGFMR
jgi:hypothetical protein